MEQAQTVSRSWRSAHIAETVGLPSAVLEAFDFEVLGALAAVAGAVGEGRVPALPGQSCQQL
jgi:hypothetical protein